jgi:hypothetical protein
MPPPIAANGAADRAQAPKAAALTSSSAAAAKANCEPPQTIRTAAGHCHRACGLARPTVLDGRRLPRAPQRLTRRSPCSLMCRRRSKQLLGRQNQHRAQAAPSRPSGRRLRWCHRAPTGQPGPQPWIQAACRARRSGSPAVANYFPSATGAPSSCLDAGGISQMRKRHATDHPVGGCAGAIVYLRAGRARTRAPQPANKVLRVML